MAEINKLSAGQALDKLRRPDVQSKQTRLDEKMDALDLPTWAQVLAAALRVYGRDVEIFSEQEPTDCLYKVVSGAVRTFCVLRDGRRHIAGFHLAGEFFGFEANSRHALSAAAICNFHHQPEAQAHQFRSRSQCHRLRWRHRRFRLAVLPCS